MMTLIGYYLLSRLNEHVQKLTTALPYAMIAYNSARAHEYERGWAAQSIKDGG